MRVERNCRSIGFCSVHSFFSFYFSSTLIRYIRCMVCGSGVILATKNVCYFDDLQCTSIYIVDDFCAAGDMR